MQKSGGDMDVSREVKIRMGARALLSGWSAKRRDGLPNVKAIRYDDDPRSERDISSDYLTVELAIDRLGVRRSMAYFLHAEVKGWSQSSWQGSPGAWNRGAEDFAELKLELEAVVDAELPVEAAS